MVIAVLFEAKNSWPEQVCSDELTRRDLAGYDAKKRSKHERIRQNSGHRFRFTSPHRPGQSSFPDSEHSDMRKLFISAIDTE
jgi:hypothetical protein